jgi:hypothetical protein
LKTNHLATLLKPLPTQKMIFFGRMAQLRTNKKNQFWSLVPNRCRTTGANPTTLEFTTATPAL